MNDKNLIRSFQVTENPYLFNIYCYESQLVGIEEDPTYLLLFQMDTYGSPREYFDWRRTKTGFGALLDVYGNGLMKNHPYYRIYQEYLKRVQKEEQIPIRRWSDRS
ncbi:hypothetical protein [Enterococcus faecalis]|uniref:hypothetical protein n=1 Tax=Enterococcus faecalis TaxID=1351 RepID=UPI0001F0C73C|nr:hypothetical protein HMPREF9499_00615 [Enterococcus faecalis TX0012]